MNNNKITINKEFDLNYSIDQIKLNIKKLYTENVYKMKYTYMLQKELDSLMELFICPNQTSFIKFVMERIIWILEMWPATHPYTIFRQFKLNRWNLLPRKFTTTACSKSITTSTHYLTVSRHVFMKS